MVTPLRLALLNLAVALAYAVSGWLGLLLAIPPGYATAIFPPAGVALAVLLVRGPALLPGVWLGSFLLNTAVGGWNWSPSALLVPGCIAVGSSAQAWLGYTLLRRRLGLPVVLDDERSMLRFGFYAAVLATTVAASVGIGSLYLAGAIAPAAVAHSWLTWWVGDAIGVLLVGPLLLMLIGEPRAFWRPLLHNAAPLMLLGLALVVAVFVSISRWENERLSREFSSAAEDIGDRIQNELMLIREAVRSVERFYAASVSVELDEFAEFTQGILPGRPELGVLQWVPAVAPDQVEAFESTQRESLGSSFTVWQRDGGARRPSLAPPDARLGHYFPIAFAEPALPNSGVLGFDLASESIRREAIQRALSSAGLVASGAVNLVQDRDRNASVLVMLPVRRPPGRSVVYSAELIVAAVKLPVALEQPWSLAQRAGLSIRLHDLDAVSGSELLLGSSLPSADDVRFVWSKLWTFGGRRWQLDISASPDYVAQRRSWQTWLALLAGLVFTALMGALMLLAHGRTARVERLVAERSEALRRSEGISSAVSAASPDGILLADAQGHIHSANAAAHALLGDGDGSLLGRPLSRSLPDLQLADCLADPGSLNEVLRCETLAVADSGEEIPVELTLTPVRTGAQPMLSCLLRDLRSREELLRLKNEFISVVNHELRTPLTSLRGSIGLLAGGAAGALPQAASELVATARSNADRLATLINDLLDFEKLELGGLQVDLQSQPLMPLLQQSLAEMQGYAAANEVQLDAVIEDGLPALSLAGDRFVQVMANLLSNAIKFSPSGGHVLVRARRHGGSVRIEVCDRGPGIPPALHDHVFSKFWQADSSSQRRHSGTGLGLAICKHLVERMHGTIGFAANPGGGTVFWCEFKPAATDLT